MVVWIRKCWFDDDAVTGWKKFFSNNAETFVGNRDDFPVDIFFSMIVNAAPVFMTLSGTRDFPVGNLAFLRAVGPFLAAATKFDGKCCNDLEAEGAVSRHFCDIGLQKNYIKAEKRDKKLEIIVLTLYFGGCDEDDSR